jgi:hypothetical protein
MREEGPEGGLEDLAEWTTGAEVIVVPPAGGRLEMRMRRWRK